MIRTLRKFVLAIFLLLSLDAGAQEDMNRVYSEGMKAYLAKNYSVAIENFTKILEKTKNTTTEEVIYVLAFSHYNEKQYEDAAKIFNMHATLFPTHQNASEVQLFLGRSLLNVEGKEDEAIKALGKAARNPEYLEEARFYAADAYINKKDYTKAAEILEKAISENVSGPGMMRACLKLIDIYIEEEKLVEAVALLKRVQGTSSYPDVIVVVNHRLVQIGDKHLEAKNYQLALSTYSSVKPHAQVVSLQTERLEQLTAYEGVLKRGMEALTKVKKPVPQKMQDRLALIVGTQDQHHVFERDDDQQTPEHQGQHTQHRGGLHRLASCSAERLVERIQRAGADVAIDNAQCTENRGAGDGAACAARLR
jgi:outer membrane protein assembly factor BamD (BamD/ComL family)